MMRRIATACCLTTIFLIGNSGCSMFGKKEAKTQSVSAYQDPYAASAMNMSYDERPMNTALTSPVNIQDSTNQIDYGHSDYLTAETPPADITAAYGSRFHTIVKGETLYSLARRYYNDQARWKEIYGANRDNISDPNMIRVGQQLVIP